MSSSSPAMRRSLSTLSIVNISIVLFMVILFSWLSRDMIGGLFSHIIPAPAGSMRGEWVGILTVAPGSASNPNDGKHQAAIRFKLGITDSFLEKYGGPGEITLAGGKSQPLEVKDLLLESYSQDGAFRGGIWLDTYTLDQARTDPISGGIKGFFQPGSLTIHRDADVDYSIDGTLHKGTDQDYEQLVQSLK